MKCMDISKENWDFDIGTETVRRMKGIITRGIKCRTLIFEILSSRNYLETKNVAKITGITNLRSKRSRSGRVQIGGRAKKSTKQGAVFALTPICARPECRKSSSYGNACYVSYEITCRSQLGSAAIPLVASCYRNRSLPPAVLDHKIVTLQIKLSVNRDIQSCNSERKNATIITVSIK